MTAPGLYLRGTLNYDALRATNQSSLKPLIKRSPLRYRHEIEKPPAQTVGQFRGSAAHIATLEPDRFMKEFALYEGPPAEGDKPKKKPIRRGKAWDEFKAANAGKQLIKQDEFDHAMRIRDAVRADPVASRYFTGKGHNECILHWTDQRTGLPCKARLDRVVAIDGVDYIVDLKGTKNATPTLFGHEAARALYHMQAAFYTDGYEQIVKRRPCYVIVAVEVDEPNEVVVYRVLDDVVDIGREEYARALDRLVECLRSSRWPGISNSMESPLVLPRWARPYEDDLGDLGLEQ